MSEFKEEAVPEEGCVGPQSEVAGKASGCAGCPNQSACASGAAKAPDPAQAHVLGRMASVKHKILVLSGKGGVGKSTFSAQLAFALAQQGKQVGILDVDICGPSIPRMLGLVGQEVHQSASGWSPVYVEDNLGVMSIGFMLPSADDAVIWRGPRKNGLIKQFLTDVVWNDLDYLIVDTPPGTSDEHISIVTYLKEAKIDGAVVVTTPQEVSMADVRKELNFCKKTGIDVIGVVENMADIRIPLSDLLRSSTSSSSSSSSTSAASSSSSFSSDVKLVDATGADVTAAAVAKIQSACPELLSLFLQSPLFTPQDAPLESNPAAMARRFNVPYLGKLPMDPNMMRACENGLSFLEHFPTSAAAAPFRDIVERIVQQTSSPASSAIGGGGNSSGSVEVDMSD